MELLAIDWYFQLLKFNWVELLGIFGWIFEMALDSCQFFAGLPPKLAIPSAVIVNKRTQIWAALFIYRYLAAPPLAR